MMLNGYSPTELIQMASIQYAGNPLKTLEAFAASVMVARKVFITDIQTTIESDMRDPVTRISEYCADVLPPTIYGTSSYLCKPVADGEVSLFFGCGEDGQFALVYSHITRGTPSYNRQLVTIKVISNVADTESVAKLSEGFFNKR